MNITPTRIADVLLIEPNIFSDSRGFFFESFNEREFGRCTGLTPHFVQDNHSRSLRHVLRGLHYQVQQVQAKLVRVIAGEIYDVAVDIRRNSPTFGQWEATLISAENRKMLWIPSGFAHGFLVLSDYAELHYKVTDYWAPQLERCIRWDDPTLAIPWPIETTTTPLLSDKDQKGLALLDSELLP